MDRELTRGGYMIVSDQNGSEQTAADASASLNRLKQVVIQHSVSHAARDKASLDAIWSQMETARAENTRGGPQLVDVAELLSRLNLGGEQVKTAGRVKTGNQSARDVHVGEVSHLAGELDCVQLDDEMQDLKNAMYEYWNEMELG